MTAPAADETLGGGSEAFGEQTAFHAQLDGTTFIGEYEVADGRVLLSSADFGQASAGLDGQAPEDVAARLLREMVGAAVARGERFMRDGETNPQTVGQRWHPSPSTGPSVMLREGTNALVWDAERLRIATDAAGVALWSWNVDTGEIAMDERAHSLWSVPRSERQITFEDLSARIHPADLNRVRTAFQGTRGVVGAYEIDFRILDGSAVRWLSARGQGGDKGIVDRDMFGVFLDVTERKQAEETREMLAGEMSHRVKNLFAIASSLTSLAARSAASTTEMAHDLTQRLAALGRAHDLIRPSPGQDAGEGALLGDMLGVLLAPYAEGPAMGSRVSVSVPQVHVGETAATTLALVVHELATNSLKYGALSAAGGAVDVSCADHDGNMVVVWTERGGPPVAAPTTRPGFGSRLVAQSMSGQLGGSVAVNWLPEGVVVTLRMSKARLAT